MTTEPTAPRSASAAYFPGQRYLASRLGRRVLLLFVLSALVPLAGVAALVARDAAARQHRQAAQELAREAEGFGMLLIGRLSTAADSLATLGSTLQLTPAALEQAVRGLPWVAGVQRVSTGPAPRERVAVVADAGGRLDVQLRQPLAAGGWLAVSVRRDWLYSGYDGYAGEGTLRVLDAQGRTLVSWGELPATGAAMIERGWEIFLRQSLASPSWRVVAARERSPLADAFAGQGYLLPGALTASLALVALLSAVAIRRQLRPLEQLRGAAERYARRDFGAPLDTDTHDEFGDLARTLQSMSGSLQVQFSALEALAEVDRLLLRSPDIGRILGALLPRMAGMLGCDALSVLLLDPDLPRHGRAWDWQRGQAGQVPLQRVCEADTWQRQGGPRRTVHALRCQEQLLGYLAVEGALDGTGEGTRGGAALSADRFADRLSLILANVEHARELHRAARFDALTGLANRRTAGEALELAIRAACAGGEPGALLYIDLDRFKRVNDTAGHRAGDELLCQVAARLQAILIPGELAARLAGDEFLLLAPGFGDEAALARRAGALIASLSEPLQVGERVLQVEASIGIAVFPRDGTRVEDLLKCADIAMYRAKESGRARALYFEPDMQRQLQQRLALEAGLRRALEREEFRLAYQPIVPIEPGAPCGLEALLRWPAGEDGIAHPPAQFVPVAEDMGLIVPLGEWVLRSACREYSGWKRAGMPCGYLSVNASTLQLRQLGFAQRVLSILGDSGLAPQELVLEVTESVFADGAAVEGALRELAAAGVRLALDDFGTGYSSLSYLGRFPFDKVKIDRSFVMGLPGDPSSCRLVESILALCASLGKQVIAEGVETEGQRAFLAESGCHALQGYLLSHPLDADAVPALLGQYAPASDRHSSAA